MARTRSLGWYAIAWIENFLVHGPGDVQGEPIELDDEFAAFALKAYELNAKGERKIRRAFLSRAKGRAKSELAAMLVCFEALGECRFDHWAVKGEVSDWGYEFEEGEPVGRPLTYVEILNVATEEGQAGNTYNGVFYMLHPDTCAPALLEWFGPIDVGLTRTFLPERRGFIEPVSASNESKDGAKSTFIIADEALALDTPLPTPTGWTTMGDVCAGDELLGSDGLPVRVLKATEVQQDRRCYRVTFEDGTSVVASEGHLWLTKVTPSAALPKIRTTGDMVADGRKFRVPVGKAWKLPEADLPVDPYLLGYWLGDGSAGQPNITVGDEDIDAVEQLLAERGISTHRLKCAKERAHRISFSRLTGFHQGTPLGDAFRALPCWRDKHIPSEFLRSSIEQRTDLLRGLMDSDGHVARNGGCVFVGADRLTADVVELLRSLGQVAARTWRPDPRSRVGGGWKVHFTPRGDLIPFALPRKAERVVQHRRGPDWVTVKSIEPVPSVPVRCVAVDAADHLFAAGDGANLTHNSHLWIPPAAGVFKLGRMHQTMVRNLLKRKESSGWMLETSTMYAKGENSVAEGTHAYARSLKASALLFDHKQASEDWDLNNRGERIKALQEAYGPAAEWMNLHAIADYWDDPQASENEFRRFWLNQPVRVKNPLAIDPVQWLALEDTSVPQPSRVALVVAVSAQRETACIAIAGDIGGRTLVMTDSGRGIDWVAEKVAMLVAGREIAEVALATGEARALQPELVRRGIEFDAKSLGHRLTEAEITASCGAFQAGVKATMVVHVGQNELNTAVGSARTRPIGKAETWDAETPIEVLAASAAFYRWGLLVVEPYDVLASVL